MLFNEFTSKIIPSVLTIPIPSSMLLIYLLCMKDFLSRKPIVILHSKACYCLPSPALGPMSLLLPFVLKGLETLVVGILH